VQSYQISYVGDSSTGALTGGNDIVLYSVIIPEPATIAGVLGLGSLALLRRRRNRK
jgi:hypothetical protein